MPICSVITCQYSQEEYEAAAEGIVFHRFPTNEEVRAKWVDMTGLDDWVPTSKDYICSRHFRDNDYFIKRSGKRYLKTAAIPCEYVVYRHLFPDEEVAEVKIEADEDDLEEASVHQEQDPKVVVIHEPEQEYGLKLVGQPGPSFHTMQLVDADQPVPGGYGMRLVDPDQPEPRRYGKQLADSQAPGPSHYGMHLADSDESGPSHYGMQLADSEEPSTSRYDIQVVDPIRGSNRGFAPVTSRNYSTAEVPDSTMLIMPEKRNRRDWERYRPEKSVDSRVPEYIFEDNSQEVDSSGFDEHYGRDEEATMNPYPPAEFDLRPHLQELPLPRTPEPAMPQLDEPERILDPAPGLGLDELLDIPIPPPIVEIIRGQQKLQDIREIMTRRKSSKKAAAAALAEVIEAQKQKFVMQTREMTENERATAIITLQTKHIVKLNIKHRRLKKTLKRISAVLRRAE